MAKTACAQRKKFLAGITGKSNAELIVKAVIVVANNYPPLNHFEDEYVASMTIGGGKGLSRRTISRAVPVVRLMCDLAVRERLSNVVSGALDFDGWTSVAGVPYQNLNLHYISSWLLHCELLDVSMVPESRTSSVIRRIAQRALRRTTPSKMVLAASVSDGASNETGAGEALTGNHLTCYAHTLQLVVRAGYESSPLKRALEKMNDLIRTTLKSKVLRRKLRALVRGNKEAQQALASLSTADIL